MNRVLVSACCLLLSFTSMAEDRIISAGAGVTELLIALDKQDDLVAVDVTSRYPAVAKLPVVGYHRQLSAEGLLSLAPDILIGSSEMGPQSTLDLLSQSGVDVMVLPTETTTENLLDTITLLGNKLDRKSQATQLISQLDRDITTLEENNLKIKHTKKMLFLLLNDKGTYTAAGSNTTAHSVMTLAGAANPAAELNSYQALSAEAFLAMAPDSILVSGRHWQKYQDIDTLIAAMPLLAETPAGRNKAIYVIDGSALIGGLGLNSIEQAKQLQGKLYPNLSTTLDLN
ncbi:ABC transporter substrate-binding protein [Moritella marina ATCC 15381]|uniref:ABC transporter substrate-binding protein n=1 Tax=Moritella marina ATCC 15381 TaxID=1202962 RepID=A0A5J6WUL3_MORMI|nr:ABC transporter substrate-binding protein [Moritella marina]QFI40082.1 ABC transporter substrate-binding protein [Moritella marina ATCC 15381]